MSGDNAIVEELMRRLGVSRREAERVFEAIFAELRERLAAGERVVIPRFGTFTVSERAAREGRHPATGHRIHIARRSVANFRPAAQLREAVASPPRRQASAGPDGRGELAGGGRVAERAPKRKNRAAEEGRAAERPRPSGRQRRSGRRAASGRFAPATRPGGRDPSSSGERVRTSADDGLSGRADSDQDERVESSSRESTENSTAAEGGRQIVVTLEGRPAGRPIPVGESTTLVFRVGRPVDHNLAEGTDRDIAEDALPPGGIETEWTIVSREVELVALSNATRVESEEEDGETVWTARFDLHLPERGESEERRLGVVPQRAGEARLNVVLTARRIDRHERELREVFRSVEVRLATGRGADRGRGAVAMERDHERAAAAHTNPATTHEWTTPPGKLTLARIDDRDTFTFGTVIDGAAWRSLNGVRVNWPVAQAQVRGAIDNARAALDSLRRAHTQYLDDIDPGDLATRLEHWYPPGGGDWSALPDYADAAHGDAWREVAASAELFDLAVEGYALYRAFFPDGSHLRRLLDIQPRGFRLDVVWRPGSGAWIPDVPWNLMHRRPPRDGQPIDPLDFLGLGFRVGHEAHEVSGVRTLGGPGESKRANLLYWHDDETGIEARRQRERWRELADQVFAPTDPADPDRMEQVLRMLEAPTPSPVAVLYVFCQADAAQPNQPRLRFGGNWAADSGVTHRRLGTGPLADEPLVFVNACDTAAGSAVYANALIESFAGRRARGYLGSMTRVPIGFAERFATVFFHLFERRFDPQPLAAGEAVALTRLFFWLHYRNLGGLFYSYVDQYDLYRASEEELQELRTG